MSSKSSSIRALFAMSTLLAGLLGASNTKPAPTQAAADVVVNGWSFDYAVTGNAEGLALQNVTYQNRRIINKISLPVMRVFYTNNVCGPYADRLSSASLRTIPWANNATIAQRQFTLNGVNWYEIGVRAVIGNYDMYQVYYLGDNGVLDAHIYARGLQCNVNHLHYPNWRVDFDLDGPANDQIQRNAGAGFTALTTEFNAAANTATNHAWRVRDTVTNLNVDVLPGFTNFSIPDNSPQLPSDSYVNHTVFGRQYRASEDIGWTQGPNVQVPYGNNESMSDLVFWYEGYMPHLSSEGAALWHSKGVRFAVTVPGGPATPTNTPTPRPTNTPTLTPTSTATTRPTNTPTATATVPPQATNTPTPRPTNTPTQSPATATPTATLPPTATSTPSASGCVDIANPGFENALNGWIVWDVNTAVTDADGRNGSRALVIGPNSNGVEQYASATPSQTVTLKAWLKANAGGEATLGLRFFDANWQNVGQEVVSTASNDYVQLQIQKVTPANAAHMQLWVSTSSTVIHADDFCLTRGTAGPTTTPTATPSGPTATPTPFTGPTFTPTPTTVASVCTTNLLLNPGFEAGISDWNVLAGTASVVNNNARSGINALRLSNLNSFVVQYLDVTGTQPYKLTAWAKRNTANPSTTVNVSFFDANWQGIGTVSKSVSGTNYEQLTLNAPLPSIGTAKYMSVWMLSNETGDTHFDDLCLSR